MREKNKELHKNQYKFLKIEYNICIEADIVRLLLYIVCGMYISFLLPSDGKI